MQTLEHIADALGVKRRRCLARHSEAHKTTGAGHRLGDRWTTVALTLLILVALSYTAKSSLKLTYSKLKIDTDMPTDAQNTITR